VQTFAIAAVLCFPAIVPALLLAWYHGRRTARDEQVDQGDTPVCRGLR
jgi:hypothetical protein